MESTQITRKIQELDLLIVKEIKRICEKNNIKYFMTAGTALGAIRHKGFIPWDDDMDLGMLRKDYDKFINCCKTELGEKFFLQTWDTDINYPFPYAKIILKDTHIVEFNSKDKDNKYNGVFIDISPFDSCPDNSLLQKIQGFKYNYYSIILRIKNNYDTDYKVLPFKRKVKLFIFSFVSIFYSRKGAIKKFDKTIRKYNHLNTLKVVTKGSYSYKKESILRKWTEELVEYKFENEELKSYKSIDEYLTYFYGDYMKLPPLEKRIGHSVLSADFGEYA